MEPRLSVVLPAYNEGPCIRENVLRVHRHLSARGSFELIVVDDGSRDDTAEQVEALSRELPDLSLLRQGRNRGKGAAVRAGMLRARGAVRAFLDADLGIPVEELDKLLSFVAEGYDCVIGSKRLPGSRVGRAQPRLRRLLGAAYSSLAGLLLVPGIKDFSCGMKVFTARAASEIFARQRIERWAFDPELLFLAHRLGFRIKETAVSWTHQPSSKVRVLLDAPSCARELAAILWYRLSGAYRLGSN